MSRLGVVRWLEMGGNATSNISVSPFSPSFKDEWFQADIHLTLCLIAIILIHLHFSSLTKLGVSSLLTLVSLATTLLLAPIVGVLLLLSAIYRQFVSSILKFTIGQKYCGLLDGTDAFWAIEDSTSLSVINVLALADFSFIVSASTKGNEPLQTIIDIIQERILARDFLFPKLMCFRHFSLFGYFYWEKQETINISRHVRWMCIEDQGDNTITESCLKNFVSSVVNSPLPADHASGWEILVGRNPIKPSSDLFDAMDCDGWMTKSRTSLRYPVLFRIHHSIGDGVALVHLFLNSLTDPSSRSNTPIPNLCSSSPNFNHHYFRSKTPTIEEPDNSATAALWGESDVEKCKKSLSCDFNSICLDITTDNYTVLRKSKTYNFGDQLFYEKLYNTDVIQKPSEISTWEHSSECINQAKVYKNSHDSRKIKEFEIVVNDRPSGEFLDLMKNATKQECHYDKKTIENNRRNLYLIFRKSTSLLLLVVKLVCRTARSIKTIGHQWSILLFAPASLLNQALMQTQDDNILHGPKLSGHKVIAWYFEQQVNSDRLLMSTIKRIRAKTGAKFSDVLLTALSASLETYYNHQNAVPECITVVIPARLSSINDRSLFENSDWKEKLENKFTVAMLPLPIATQTTGRLRLFKKLRQIRRHSELLRRSPDFLVNYWLLRVVGTFLPSPLLRPMFASTHCTLVLSNLPGPSRLTHLAGHPLHDLVFWIPHRTTTGIGVTVLSYAGRLQIGLMADRALVNCQRDAQQILDGIATAIRLMDDISSPTSS